MKHIRNAAGEKKLSVKQVSGLAKTLRDNITKTNKEISPEALTKLAIASFEKDKSNLLAKL